jgi:catechol 2,3-dioxygenase-like lactoylglutathione lyase family enzyme
MAGFAGCGIVESLQESSMTAKISDLLTSYEHGRLSRRQLIQGLAALAAGGYAAPASGSTFQGMALNHIAIRVTNVLRSRDFYERHFGLPLIGESETGCFLGLGKNFLTLFQNQTPGLDHFCIAIQSFDADAVLEELKDQGLKAKSPSGSDRVYFPDPDGLTVQLSSVDRHA